MTENRELSKERETISSMFNSIAPTYDLLNHLLSFGIDISWRKKLVKSVAKKTEIDKAHILDLACGTGDVSIAIYNKGAKVTGADISEEMVKVAIRKCQKSGIENIDFIIADASQLPFEENTFDGITISFGIRNFDKRSKCIEELYRVLKPGGLLAILEFSIPKNKLWKGLYTFYFRKILPAVGNLVSKQKWAYTYLPESSFRFPCREDFCKELESGKFIHSKYKSLTGGVACLYTAIKPANLE